MRSPLQRFLAVVGVCSFVVAVAACSGGSAMKAPPGDAQGGQDGATVALTTGTCWSALRAGADPQVVLQIAKQFSVTYFHAAYALADRPAFARTRACSGDHSVEVYKAVRLSDVTPTLVDYTAFLQSDGATYRTIDQAVRRACLDQTLLRTADASGVPGAVVGPALPTGFSLGWAPPSPAQWAGGQRVYACTLTQTAPSPISYASAFTHAFPTEDRTCIDSTSLLYVDCARKHDRERIAVIDVTAAVLARKFPGSGAIRVGPAGRFVDLSRTTYAALDRACTTYLKAVSSTTKLSGVAETEVGQWPTSSGRFLVTCEADTPPPAKPVITQGSVYDN